MKQVLFFALAFSVLIVSCGKFSENNSTTTSEDVAMVEGGFNEVQKVMEDVLKENQPETAIELIYGSGATLTVTPPWPDMTFPKTFLIEFGDGVTDLTGNVRTGSIEVVATGLYRDSAAVFTTTPIDYTLNNYAIEGVKTVTNMGTNDLGNTNFDISIVDGVVTDPEGISASWESERNREWIDGEDTNWLDGLDGILDDTYSLTGTASGLNRNGIPFEMVIAEPLIVSVGCKWVKQGVLEITPEGLNTRTLDYGDGECDNEASISIGNFSLNFFMW